MQNKKEFGLILNKASTAKTNKQAIKTFVTNSNNGNNSDDDEEISPTDYKALINKNISKQQDYNTKKIADEISKNIIIDPNIYEYDSLYENTDAKRNQIRNKTNPMSNYYSDSIDNSKPKYLNAILAASEKRKIEQSIIKEKVEKKRREREEGEYGDKPKYVTKSYEQALALNKKTEVDMEHREQKNTVNSDYGMMGFYSNLLTKNSAMGAKSVEEKEELELLKIYQNKKKDYEKVIDKEKDDEVDKNITERGKDKIISGKKFDEELIVNEIKKLKNSKDEAKDDKVKPNADELPQNNSVDEVKLRYLERKRQREEKKD